jgi:hypothetical protein
MGRVGSPLRLRPARPGLAEVLAQAARPDPRHVADGPFDREQLLDLARRAWTPDGIDLRDHAPDVADAHAG